MRAGEFIVEHGFNWDEYRDIETIDRIKILEAHYTHNGNLEESNDSEIVDYFRSLTALSVIPEVGNTYTVCVAALVNNDVQPLYTPAVGKIISKQHEDYVVKTDLWTRTLPSVYEGEITAYTFFFEDEDAYDKFRTIIKLRFNRDLPKGLA